MPKIAKNYNNCIIYKLVCLDTTYPEVYVGSTTCFKQRKSNHKSKCHNENAKGYNLKIYQYMREHGGFENFTMIEIEEFPCENNRQLEAREEHWRKELHATLNGQQAFRTEDEKRIQKSEWQKNEGHTSHLLSMKKWCDANKEKKKMWNKAYQEANKEKTKAYYQANKEKIRQQNKEYRLRKKLEKLNITETI